MRPKGLQSASCKFQIKASPDQRHDHITTGKFANPRKSQGSAGASPHRDPPSCLKNPVFGQSIHRPSRDDPVCRKLRFKLKQIKKRILLHQLFDARGWIFQGCRN
jgi:hypothetical protein